jgi:predicted metalloprotease
VHRRIVAAVGATILVVACSSRLDGVTVGPPTGAAPPTPATSGSAPTTSADTSSTNIKGSITDTPSIHVSGPRRTRDYDGFVALVVADIESFWKSSYPTIAGGQPYQDLDGGLWPVGPRARDVPGCGEPRTDYREVQDNAFYCPDGDFIAFDDAALFPQLESRFGRYTVATVLAHEWGHAIQHRRGYSLSGVLTELQADCFSGAWMGHVRGGGAPQLQLSDGDLRRAITGILEFRDDPGTSAQEQGAHGSAFDRLGSFQDGLDGGPTACDAYSVSPPVVLELPFESQADADNQGNLPLDTLVHDVPKDLDRFWESVLQQSGRTFPALSASVRSYVDGGPYPSCTGLTAADFKVGVVYCPNPEFVAYEEGGENAQLHDTIGDFSVGVLFADSWAKALQHRLGLRTDGDQASLQRDCLTGAWVADVVPRPTRPTTFFAISPGDLDEAVQTYLVFTKDESADEALARIGSFREGIFSGLPSCGL